MTVRDALIECGVDDVGIFLDQTPAERTEEDIFDNIFTSCMDVTFKELDEHFKTFSELSVAQGQIRLRPGIRKNIKAFVQWTPDEIRLACDPGATVFPVDQVSDLIRHYKMHENFQNNSKTLAEAANPKKFKESIKWEDWKPSFLNCL